MMKRSISNALTVDVEDWHQLVARRLTGVLPPPNPIVVENTRRMLDLFERYGARATCFILGTIAEAFPELVREIVQRGHAIGTHGDQHIRADQLTPAGFRADIQQSLTRLQQITPAPVRGYRAPEFSITAKSLWALDILRECGLAYDASVFPFAGRRYGIPNTPLAPHRLTTPAGARFAEFPLTVVPFAGRVWPVAGGGYLRILPYALTRSAIRQVNAAGRAAVVYLHPYEIEPRLLRPAGGGRGGRMTRLRWLITQNIGRRHIFNRLERLLGDFTFGALEDLPDYDKLTCA